MNHFSQASWKHKSLITMLALTILGVSLTMAADHSRFHDLSATDQGKIIWGLHENKEWDKPEQKPIVEVILATQMPGEANFISYVDDAIAMTEKYGWKEFYPLIQAIHDQPHCPYVNQRAFLSIRFAKGSFVPTEIVADAKVLGDAGYYQTTITDERLQGAVARLVEQPDHEALVTYLLTVVVEPSGKGGTDRGHFAAWTVLNSEPPDLVKRELDKARRSYNQFYQEELQRALVVRAKTKVSKP